VFFSPFGKLTSELLSALSAGGPPRLKREAQQRARALAVALLVASASVVSANTAHTVVSANTAYSTVIDTMPVGGLVRSSPAGFAKATTWLYGDSLTVQMWRNLHLRNGLAVDAKWGRSSAPTVDKLMVDLHRALAIKRMPRVVVLAVGSNDFGTPAALRAAIARVRHAATVQNFRLVWVNTYNEARNPVPTNRIIAAGGPLLHVANWYALCAAHRRPSTGRSPWLVDGLHVNIVGAQQRANLIQRAMTTQLAAWRPR
jgi:lysophospholipase L1-like esterase